MKISFKLWWNRLLSRGKLWWNTFFNKIGLTSLIIYLSIGVFMMLIGIYIAPHLGSPAELVEALTHPAGLSFCSKTLPTVALCLLFYALVLVYIATNKKKRRPGAEYGGGRIGQVWELADLKNKTIENNLILTEHVQLSMDTHQTWLNTNVLVDGGSGKGKTSTHVEPNIMQMNHSVVVLDPKGDTVDFCFGGLYQNGYDVKVLDFLPDAKNSWHYNPFHYVRSPRQVLVLVNNLIDNTTGKNVNKMDPFWEKGETALTLAIMFLLLEFAPPEEQNFTSVVKLVQYCKTDEEDSSSVTAIDVLMNGIAQSKPNCMAVMFYRLFQLCAGKTAKSIAVSVAFRLAVFLLPEIEAITKDDEIELDQLGDRKCALFLVIPDDDRSFNFIVGMLYTQMFQCLYARARQCPGNHLKIPVHILADEFANVAMPANFRNILATMRSRWISISIILQSLADLKTHFKDEWESIYQLCDTFLYLGGNEPSTFKWISELFGKETIDVESYSRSRGMHGSYTTNFNKKEIEVLPAEKVRKLNSKQDILFISGRDGVIDNKYFVQQHPNYKMFCEQKMEYCTAPHITHPYDKVLDMQETQETLEEILALEENTYEKTQSKVC